jgi:hypothetical protein
MMPQARPLEAVSPGSARFFVIDLGALAESAVYDARIENPALGHAAGRKCALAGYRRHDLAHRSGQQGLKVSEVRVQKLGEFASRG